MPPNYQNEIEQLFEKHKETILQGRALGLRLRTIFYGQHSGDPDKIESYSGGIPDFVNFVKSTGTELSTVAAEVSKLLAREQYKELDVFINNNTDKGNTDTGLVDERFELCSLIAKLAGYAGYSHDCRLNKNVGKTNYQSALLDNFTCFDKHSAIQFLSTCGNNSPSYAAMFALAMSLEKENGEFMLAESDRNLSSADGRLSAELVENFLPHLNSFYSDSKFGEWFENNAEFYREFSKKFSHAQSLDFAWYEKFGIKKENMSVIASPSNSISNYAAKFGDKTFALVQGDDGKIVHEFCHSFCNPIAYTWFNEDPQFKELCEKTVGHPNLDPAHDNSRTIGCEYVTRSFDIIYNREHCSEADWDVRFQELLQINGNDRGFPFIKEVLEMAKTYNKEVNRRHGAMVQTLPNAKKSDK